ncbi:ELMO domain-containing protein A [Nymphaea thermarum]|nr:ELMO domain-containing protein A [Nymphaea thermarum]
MNIDRGYGVDVGSVSSSSIARFAYGVTSSSSADATNGTLAWRAKGVRCVCIQRKGTYERISINLTALQEERLRRLKHRIKACFDSSHPHHQEALKALWSAAYPGEELHGLISEQWKEMGWQGRDPSTDFRGAGFIALENLLFFAKTFSASFQYVLNKQGGKRATWEYPFAVAGVNITFMIIQMLDLHSCKNSHIQCFDLSLMFYLKRAHLFQSYAFAAKPRTLIGAVFMQMLAEDEWAFDLLYCIAFVVMDAQWLAKNASYMDFNEVLKSTRAQLEKEFLLEDVYRIEDMPSYNLLCQY